MLKKLLLFLILSISCFSFSLASYADEGKLGLDPSNLNAVGAKTVSTGSVTATVNTIANILVGIIAAVSIFFVIKGAWEWINGNEKNQAQQTIINAVIGLIIAILAFFIVQFAVGAGGFLNNTLDPPPPTSGS